MNSKLNFALLAGSAAVALGLAVAPAAVADPGEDCNTDALSTVCESNGSADEVARPPMIGDDGGFFDQNGPYGPAGDVPPVGRR